ncbi:MAG: GGDEF domain-containing protein [Proteobacteria bacterium]|nr:GGDEF domain-containing protein [Pseudomonadota bacterium]
MKKNSDVIRLENEVKELSRENMVLDSKVIELFTLYSISKKLSLATYLEEIFNGTMKHISTSLNMDDFCILLLDEVREKLVVSANYGDMDLIDMDFDPGEGISGQVLMSGSAKLIQDISKEKGFLFYNGRKKNIGAFLCIPLKSKEGIALGTMNVHKPEPNSFGSQEILVFNEVAGQIAIAVDKAISFRNVKELAIRDAMTGLYNRRYFFDYFEREMERAKRYNNSVAVIIVDVDHFKNFNDKNGHLLGDAALKMVASQLDKHLRQSDVVARLGGEEFIIALTETPKADAVEVAEKLRNAIEMEPVDGEDSQPGGKLTATFGVSAYPEDAEFATELIECADQALYVGKGASRNIVISYEPH